HLRHQDGALQRGDQEVGHRFRLGRHHQLPAFFGLTERDREAVDPSAVDVRRSLGLLFVLPHRGLLSTPRLAGTAMSPLYSGSREKSVEAGVKKLAGRSEHNWRAQALTTVDARAIVSQGETVIPRLSLTLLGGFRAHLGPGPPLTLPTRKAQALLAYLGLPPGRAHPRDKLASLLWGNTVETTARTSLRQTLYAIRKRLSGADPLPLQMHANTVALDPAAVSVDVEAFEQGMAEATPSALADSLALYKGDFLEGLSVQEPPFEDWLLAQRERLRELAVGGLARLLAHQRSAGASEAAVQTAQRLLDIDPLQEPIHRALMQLYVETGQRGAALRQYQRCVATLQRELRAEPEAPTKTLYQEILRRRARGVPDAEHRLVPAVAALGQPQLAVPEAPGAGEPPLVGRDQSLARLEVALERALAGQGLLLVMIGEAGIGKSRLVAELLATAIRRQGRVLIGRCYETERILPFAPWVDALRTGRALEERELIDSLEPGWRAELARLLPELPSQEVPAAVGEPVGQVGGDARHLFEAITELLRRLAQRQPLVVALEDLHWADEMSVRLLAFLGRRVRAVPLLALATIR